MHLSPHCKQQMISQTSWLLIEGNAMEKPISGGTVPADLLGNQIFVSAGGCGLERDTNALIWKLCISLFHWAFLTCSRVVSVHYSWATIGTGELLCPLPPSLGQFADSHRVWGAAEGRKTCALLNTYMEEQGSSLRISSACECRACEC